VFGASAAAKGSTLTAAAKGKEIAVNALTEKSAFQGYFKYMFWDKESNLLPFEVGSYLGSKKVLNIGAGFYTHPDATAMRTSGVATADSITRFTQNVFGADVFLDMPLNKEKGTAVSALLTYYNMDFGQNYLRNVGILNEHPTSPASTPNSFAGGGNAQPLIGTGNIVYAQVGYLLPKKTLKVGQLMPYATVTYKDFERLADPSTQFGLGLNWLTTGHNAKITAEYQTRPVYKTNTATGAVERNGSAGQIIIQSHIFL